MKPWPEGDVPVKMHPDETWPQGRFVTSQARRIVPGRTAFPAKHSDLCSSQASTFGFPVKPAALIRNKAFDSSMSSTNV